MRFKINHLPLRSKTILEHGGINRYMGASGYLGNTRAAVTPSWSPGHPGSRSTGELAPSVAFPAHLPSLNDEVMASFRMVGEPLVGAYLGAPRFVGESFLPSIGGPIGLAWQHWGITAVTDEHRQRLVDGLHPVTGEKVVRESRGRAEYTPIHEFVLTVPKELSLFLDRPEVAEGLRLGMVRVFQDIEARAVAGGHRDPLPVAGLAGEWSLHLAGRGLDGQKPEPGKGGVPHQHIHLDVFSVAPLRDPRTHAVGRKSKRHPERDRKTKTTDHGRFDAQRALANRVDGPRLEALLAGTVIEHLRETGWTLAPPMCGECPGVGLMGWKILAPDGRRPTQAMVKESSPRRQQIEAARKRPETPRLVSPGRMKVAWARRYSEVLVSAARTVPPLIGVGTTAQHIRNLMKETQHERQTHLARTRIFGRTGRFAFVPAPGSTHLGRPDDTAADRDLFTPALGRIEKPFSGRVDGGAGELPGTSQLGHPLRTGAGVLGDQDHLSGAISPKRPIEPVIDLGGPCAEDVQSRPPVRPDPVGLSTGTGGGGWDEALLHPSPNGPDGGDRDSVRPSGTSEDGPGGGLGSGCLGNGGCLEGAVADAAPGLSVIPSGQPADHGKVLLRARVLEYAMSDADAVRLDLSPSFVEASRLEQIHVAAEFVARERWIKGKELEQISVAMSRGIVRVESWAAAADADLPVASWPMLRPLAHQPLRDLDPERPEIGEVRYNSPMDLWKSFKHAARSAVAWLKRHLGVPAPRHEAPSISPKQSPLHSTGDDHEHVPIKGLLNFLGEDDVVPGGPGPQFETLEQIEERLREKKIKAMRVDVAFEIPRIPRRRIPGNQ